MASPPPTPDGSILDCPVLPQALPRAASPARPLSGSDRTRRTVVVGRSNVVGRPLAAMLLARDSTVTICHRKTVGSMPQSPADADILAVATGASQWLILAFVRRGATVLDFGINVVTTKWSATPTSPACWVMPVRLRLFPEAPGRSPRLCWRETLWQRRCAAREALWKVWPQRSMSSSVPPETRVSGQQRPAGLSGDGRAYCLQLRCVSSKTTFGLDTAAC